MFSGGEDIQVQMSESMDWTIVIFVILEGFLGELEGVSNTAWHRKGVSLGCEPIYDWHTARYQSIRSLKYDPHS